MANNFRHILLAATLLPAAMLPGLRAEAANTHVKALEDYTYPAKSPASIGSLVFMPAGDKLAELSADGKKIILRDARSGEADAEALFDVARARETAIPDIEGFIISPDASKILVWRNSEPLYRRSFTAEYYVYECRSRLLRPLSKEHKRQRAALFSPNSRMVAFTVDGNVRIAKLDYGTEVEVSTDGCPGKIINGVPDWTYEEEFGVDISMTWAPDNLTLCYLRYDESAVGTYTLPLYQGYCEPMDAYELYPGSFSYKYPVAGTANSSVSLLSYDVETRKTKTMEVPGQPEYIPTIAYGPDENSLIATALNRDQNRLEVFKINPKSTVARSLMVEESKAWIEESIYTDLWLGPTSFVIGSSRSGYRHLYEYSYMGAQLRQLTSGNFDVTAYYGSDASGNHYYQAAAPDPTRRSIYRIDRKGSVSAIGSTEGTASAIFAPGMACMIRSYSDCDTPPVHTLCRADGKELATLEDNAAYRSRTAPMLAAREFFTMQSEGGVELNGYIVKPRDFDPSRRYPVVMSQYSGPGSQSVLRRWNFGWEDYYASQGYLVMCVDGRGTGGRGSEFREIVYCRLGHYETIDQLAAARHAASLPYVDASRIGIYGWSYGGYEALMCASAKGAPYAAAVAIAAVTDWRYYDTVYAERFMLTPQQNEDGYRASAPISRAADLSCPLLLMYGTLDDNVHPANSLNYAATLQSKGMFCDMFVFPNMNHSINGCTARAVVYAKMLDYFNKNMR